MAKIKGTGNASGSKESGKLAVTAGGEKGRRVSFRDYVNPAVASREALPWRGLKTKKVGGVVIEPELRAKSTLRKRKKKIK